MAVLYRVSFKLASDKTLGSWFPAQGLGAAMERVTNRMNKQDGPWRQRDRGEPWGRPRSFQDARERYRLALENNEIGDIRIMVDTQDAAIATRKVHIVEVDFPTISSNATARAKAIVVPLWTEFPSLQYWGCYNCRHIAGSSSWSEHAWADAVDVHPPTMAYGDRVYHWLMAHKAEFGITRVLWRVTGHFDHLHIDFDPDHSGTPPCAL